MKKYKFETLELHAGLADPKSSADACAVPIYQTAAYVFHDCDDAEGRFALRTPGSIYGRLTNPTQDAFEKRIAALEGAAAALGTASGAAAINYAVTNIAHSGDHIIAQKTIYGGSRNLFLHTLADSGISVTFVDVNNESELRAAFKSNTKLVFAESLGNPNSDVTDIELAATIAHENGVPLIVDNTFATPYLIRPIEYGADIVVHSATKFIGGHGTAVGGVIADSGKFLWSSNDKFPSLSKPDPSYHGAVFCDAAPAAPFVTRIRAVLLRDTGGTIAPLHAFLFLQGLETLSLRVERHVSNALRIAEFLNSHNKVKRVNHPAFSSGHEKELYDRYYKNGAGSVFTAEIGDSEEDAKKFIDRLELFSIVANVADVKSLVIHPASTTHSQLSKSELAECGIAENSVRFSVGLENIDDLLYDLDNALKF